MTAEDKLRRAQAAVDVAQESLGAATAERDAAVHDAYAEGMPVPVIADTLGIHRQMVYKILRRP